ncbi:hypothetical protein B0H16DRAFT_1455064 [Mycena metata]|uniref:DNA 3'-5' helicase n=1 Tax=Mycena metata TaxID=1033252 RepID=A0AAD7NJR7_9AGAR|nr:hypothetical protein B0H16DRAFT_1455064 [Mycena metata]
MSTDACGLCNQAHASEDSCDSSDVNNSSLPDFQQYSWGIVTTPVLRSVSIGVNQDISLFVCLTCTNAYTTTNIVSHLGTHPGRLTPDVKREILEIGNRSSLEAHYPSWATEGSTIPRPEIAGVSLKQNMKGCPMCAYTAVHDKVVDHMKTKKHTGTILVGLCAQVLNSGATKSNIRVDPRPPPVQTSNGPVPDILAEFRDFDWRAHRKPEIPNARMISPWLMRTRWHEQVLPYRPHVAELLQLVAMPSLTEQLPGRLHESVKQYFRHATELLDHTSELVLQLLNSKNPDKDGINNTPLHAHHQRDKTLTQYATVVTRLLAALLRPRTQYTFPTSVDLSNALEAFRAVGENANNQPALHSILMALWKTQWPSDREQHFPDPTMCFLMLFSVKKEGEFAQPKETTGPIAKLCRGIQLAMVQEIHRLVKLGDVPTQMAAWEIVAPFCVEKQMTTFNSLMSLQHYATDLTYRSMSLPRIWWVDRDTWEVMLYEGKRITLTQLGDIFDSLEKKIVDLWDNDVMLGLGLHVKYADLADNLAQTRTGYSFLDDPSNPFSALGTAFADKLFADPELLAKFVTVDADGKQHLNVVFCRQWMMSLAKLEGLIMLAIDMMSGAPPRGTELVSMLACNTENRGRNLRALGHFLAIVRQYDKTTNNLQSDRLIPHAVSAVNADILVQLHTFARPWARFLAKILFPTNLELIARYGEMLFMDFGKEFTSDKLSALMAEWSGKTLGWEMKISDFRQINIAWRRKLCRGPYSIEAIESDTTSIINALQAGHSPPTENRTYGLSPDAWLGASEDVFHLYLLASIEWQKVLKVVPGGLALPYKDATRDKFDGLVVRGIIKMNNSLSMAAEPVSHPPIDATLQQMFMDFQRKSTQADAVIVSKQDETLRAITDLRADVDCLRRQIQGMAPAAVILPAPLRQRAITPRMHSIPSNLLQSGLLQALWVLLLQPPAEWPIATPIGPTPAVWWLKEFAVPTSPSQQEDLLASLQRVYGAQADWRDPQQYHALKAVLALRNDIIVAMKTGSGKTLVAILPSMVEQGYTVIIVPLLALLEDWIRRLDSLNIRYERFLGAKGPATLSGQHNLILVSSDIARTPRWRDAIEKLHSGRKPVLRYVVDEVGYYFTDLASGFRNHAFLNPFQLRQFPCQVVLMGAAIPPAAEAYLVKQFLLADHIRFSTTCDRTELLIKIMPACRNLAERLTKAQKIIEDIQALPQWKPRSRFLGFVSSYEDGQAAAKFLKLPFYHAHSPEHPITDEARQKIYNDWVAGVTLGIIATTALGAGNDYPHVLATIHIDVPWDVVTFVQQCGRAGRDGRKAVNHVIPHKSPRRLKDVDPENGDMGGAQVMQDIVYHNAKKSYPESCTVYAITSFIDGKGSTFCALAVHCNDVSAAKEASAKECLAKFLPTATPSPSLPKNKSLPWNRPTDLKRKLTDAFGPVTETARKRNCALIEAKYGKLQVFKDLFDLVGQTCGYCFARGVKLEESAHKWSKCDKIAEAGQMAQINEFRVAINYPTKGGPCFRCYIASMGQNALHPEFVTGETVCTHPNLMLPLAYAIYATPELHHRAKAYFFPQANAKDWNSIQQYAEWFSTPHPEFAWQSMAMLKWASEYFLERVS